jgi:hypothetical protein
MAEGKIPGVRQASIKEVRELVKVAVRDEELSDRDTDARLLPDGRVLLYHGEHERGVVYLRLSTTYQSRIADGRLMRTV